MDRKDGTFDLIVVGAGPGGYVAAIRAAQLGQRVAIVDRGARLGGTCLNVGCIPTKALLESSHHYAQVAGHGLEDHGIRVQGASIDLSVTMARKDRVVRQLTDGVAYLMKRNRIQVFQGEARLAREGNSVDVVAADGTTTELTGAAVVLASGSEPVPLPGLPFDHERILDSTDALSLTEVPGHLVVVGAGAVGLELGLVWRRFGAKVTVVELMPTIAPFADRMISRTLQRALEAQGIEFLLGHRVQGADQSGARVTLTLEGPEGQVQPLTCDRVLVAIGRRPATGWLAGTGVELDERGRVVVDERLATSRAGLYAIGDLIPGPMLAHKAEGDGVAVAEIIAGTSKAMASGPIPSVIYTWPELAVVGIGQDEARAEKIPTRVGRFLFKANGRAATMGEREGAVAVVAHRDTGELLGVHMVGPGVSELVAEATVALASGMTARQLGEVSHAHPSLAEALKEAALAAAGHALHA